MTKAATALAFAASLAGGCSGTIDPGEPIDYALACGPPSSTRAQVSPLPRSVTVGDFVPGVAAAPTGMRTGYVPVAVDPAMPILGPGVPRTIYLNGEGATIMPGYDDAAHNSSSVLLRGGQNATIPKANFSDAEWLQLVACVSDEYSRFNVQIVRERPMAPGYMMAMIGGAASDLGLPNGVGGVAPIDPNGCAIIENAIVYAFSDSLGNLVKETCEATAQEIGHAFSLDHEMLASDPMTYLPFGGHKVFQDKDAPCGENADRQCICTRPSQNSVQILGEKAGFFQDPNGPAVSITSPDDGVQLAAGDLPITVHATSAMGVARVTLHYHDAASFVIANCSGQSLDCTQSGADYTFRVKRARGIATFFAEAADKARNTNVSHTRTVSVGSGPNPDTGAIQITVAVDLSALLTHGPAVVNAGVTTSAGTISGVTLRWTDRRGVTGADPMCPSGMNTWNLAEQIAPLGGDRSFLVEADDSAGNHAVSPRFSIIADY